MSSISRRKGQRSETESRAGGAVNEAGAAGRAADGAEQQERWRLSASERCARRLQREEERRRGEDGSAGLCDTRVPHPRATPACAPWQLPDPEASLRAATGGERGHRQQQQVGRQRSIDASQLYRSSLPWRESSVRLACTAAAPAPTPDCCVLTAASGRVRLVAAHGALTFVRGRVRPHGALFRPPSGRSIA